MGVNLKRLPLVLVGLCLTPPALAAQDEGDPLKPELAFEALVLMNGFYTSTSTNNSDVPQFVIPVPPGTTLPPGGLGATMRQSRLQVFALWPELGGAEVRATFDMDFFGGQEPSGGGRFFAQPRIRRAFAQLAWDHVELFVGQAAPAIAELNPESFAMIGFPEFSGSGNLWLWIPQVRAAAVLRRGSATLGIEAALLAPSAGEPNTEFTTDFDRAERSGRPSLEGRIFARWGSGRKQGDATFGGHLGWLAVPGEELVESKALVLGARVPLAEWLEIRGEAFTGQALAGLGGGGIGQNLGPGAVPVATTGAWAQVLVRPIPELEIGGGFGIDNPDDADLDPAVQRLENLTYMGQATWRKRPFVVSLEYRHIRTTYGPPIGELPADHINLGMGLLF